MTELLTGAQMRAVEAAAIASGKVTGLELMERAGRGVVEAVFGEWPELRVGSFRAVVLCGPGNNGGDGFVVARLLKEWGWEVEVFLHGDAGRLPPDARTNYERWRTMGEVRDIPSAFQASGSGPDLVVDALFGTGLTRAVEGLDDTFREMADARKSGFSGGRSGFVSVAIDLPSGICSDSGRALTPGRFGGLGKDAAAEPAAAVDLTVTFHAMKLGHHLSDGPSHCGRVRVCDIGLDHGNGTIRTVEPDTFGLMKRDGHKYTYGHALVLSGPTGRGGAARLAARGALRIGAGLVTVGCPVEALPEHAARLDAVMLREAPDAAALGEVLEDGRINALCLGPGMGVGEREAGLVAVALGVPVGGPSPPAALYQGDGRGEGAEDSSEARPLALVGSGDRRRVVLDADALTILAGRPELFAALHEGCVVTPHVGEFARLFPDIAGKLSAPASKGPAFSKVDAAREAAARAGCVVLFKGADTVIAGPDGRCAINSAHYDRAAPWLATAGSGDVLAGLITGLLARGFSPFDAACTGAWLHVECARSIGPGLIAEDLADALPKVFRALEV
ncbi:NAD(P)H-hydrate epimerase [Tabrizicola sp. BL-A-41-H6]|uniref:NAD(P)H-hydrate epimerase n=1 Tax=Tabrizicola sp. BL-A-41-H6 TaxID=3421107 RepID=UPI003D67200D